MLSLAVVIAADALQPAQDCSEALEAPARNLHGAAIRTRDDGLGAQACGFLARALAASRTRDRQLQLIEEGAHGLTSKRSSGQRCAADTGLERRSVVEQCYGICRDQQDLTVPQRHDVHHLVPAAPRLYIADELAFHVSVA